jgi:ectoine hydroxylase-related dioxygenase (phytanoyl-CoA dioxygenase family)
MLIAGFLKEQIASDGFVIADSFLDLATVLRLRAEADRLLGESSQRGGVRNALHKSSQLRELATSGAPFQVAIAHLGPSARPVKLTIFDKTARANWKVPWHQDLTISVRQRRDLPGFGLWSVKGGVPHVQPPVDVLARTIAIRVHLDETTTSNGALRVLPGTHRLGRIAEADIPVLRQQIPETVCPVPAGGAMAMSPLLLHASSPSVSPSRRRVLHFEFSDYSLPDGLSWA